MELVEAVPSGNKPLRLCCLLVSVADTSPVDFGGIKVIIFPVVWAANMLVY